MAKGTFGNGPDARLSNYRAQTPPHVGPNTYSVARAGVQYEPAPHAAPMFSRGMKKPPMIEARSHGKQPSASFTGLGHFGVPIGLPGDEEAFARGSSRGELNGMRGETPNRGMRTSTIGADQTGPYGATRVPGKPADSPFVHR